LAVLRLTHKPNPKLRQFIHWAKTDIIPPMQPTNSFVCDGQSRDYCANALGKIADFRIGTMGFFRSTPYQVVPALDRMVSAL